ncbi:MAG TPA: hypothetical protein VLK65_20140 [Vicinamibacteria bacterium]|nr:hypothetical protein [Vicinamibacteria bacterium]
MNESRDRYGAIIESGLKAGGLYDGFVTDLKNQCRYFEVDMSDSGMAKLTSNRSETQQKARRCSNPPTSSPARRRATSSR